MKKINRKVYFEFSGFENIDGTTVDHNGKAIKLFSKNFDKILNLIIHKIQTEGINQKNGYVDIPSNAFKSAFDNYKPYLNYLITNGFLERSYFVYRVTGRSNPEFLHKNYRKNKPFGYRFTEHFKEWIKVKRIVFVPNVSSLMDCESDKNDANKKVKYNFFLKPEILKRLKRDYNSCQILNEPVQKSKMIRSKYIDIGKWFYNQIELFKWQRGDKTFKFSTGRLYTNFTRLSSNVRLNNVRLNNEILQCKDISNSFPLMLAIYCISQNPDLKDDIDFIEYCSWVTTGTFYDNMTKALNAQRNADESHRSSNKRAGETKEPSGVHTAIQSKREFPKDVVKLLFQIYLNGKADGMPLVEGFGDSLIKDFMKLKFNCVHEQVLNLKQNKHNVYDYLVKEESKFIFKVVENLYKKYLDIKLLTVHDSIYTAESDFYKLEIEWNKQFKNLITILPTEPQYDLDENFNFYSDLEISDIDESYFENDFISSKKSNFGSYQRMDLDFF